MPGGKPVMAGFGHVSRSRLRMLGPVLVTPAPARTDAAAVVPRLMVVGVAAPALRVMAPARARAGMTTSRAPRTESLREPRRAARVMRWSARVTTPLTTVG